jgi:hypothetical protein
LAGGQRLIALELERASLIEHNAATELRDPEAAT